MQPPMTPGAVPHPQQHLGPGHAVAMHRGDVPSPPAPPAPTRLRGGIPRWVSLLVAWCVIVGIVVGIAALNAVMSAMPPEEGEDGVGLTMMRIQSRLYVGQNALMPGGGGAILAQAEVALNIGTPAQRLRFVALAGELGGAEHATATLDELVDKVEAREDVAFSEQQQRTVELLRTLYTDYANAEYDAPSLTEGDRTFLVEQLDWFGELALAPAGTSDHDARAEAVGPAKRAMAVALIAVFAGGFVGLAGLIGLIILIVLAAIGRLPNRIGHRLPYGHVYAETFAIWLIAFFALNFVGELLPVPAEHALAVSAVMFFLSLTVLIWPVLRGVSFGRVRHDIGLTGGSLPPAEPFIGAACYAMTLPLLAVGLVGVFIISFLVDGGGLFMGGGDEVETFGPSGGPAHPIIEFAGGGQIWPAVQLYLVAAIAAPVVEETMFRGVLYRHLRSISAAWGVGLSVLFGAVFNSFIFAIIHPQGIVAVPALASLAIGMTLAREWRGTLIPSMVIHGISNGAVMTMLLLFVS